MSYKNIKINSPDNKLSSPYYITDIKLEILKKTGINITIYEKINTIDISNKKKKYFNIFKSEIDSEIDIFFNYIKLNNELDIYNKDFLEHVNNINQLIEIIYEMLL